MKARHAEIAGAGLAGLAAAAALGQRGWTVRVHEKSTELREIGAGIFLWENALATMESIGAYDSLAADGENVRIHTLQDHRGRTLQGGWLQAEGRLHTVERQTLHEALVQAAVAEGAEIVTNSRVIGADPAGALLLENGDRAAADLVIGADGVFSGVRESLGLTECLFDLEDGCGRYLVDRRPDDPHEKTFEIWSGGRRLGVAPTSRRTVYLFLCCPSADPASNQDPFDGSLWKQTYGEYADFIDRIPRKPDGRYATFHQVHVSSWSKGRVALLGDAAHAMAPNLGQGACTGITNALALSQAVSESGLEIEPALKRWEESERTLIDEVQRYSYLYGRIGTRWPAWPGTLDLRSALIWSLGKSRRVQTRINSGATHIPSLSGAAAHG